MHHPFKFLSIVALGYLTLLLVFGDTTSSTPSPATTTSRPPAIEYEPITTSSTSTSTVPATAHDALQADLEDPNSFVLAELDLDLPCQEWAPLALEVGWPADQLPTLLRVIWRESRCQPAADSGPDHGLTQINLIHRDWIESMGMSFDDMFDPRANLRFAYDLWRSRTEQGQCGWTPWSVECA